jgi:hypothetical protein
MLSRTCLVIGFLLYLGSPHAAELGAFSKITGSAIPAPWQVIGLPERYNKPVTQFDLTDVEGSRVLRVKADKSWGSLAHPIKLSVTPESKLRWRWRLEQPLAKSDIHSKATEDSAMKVCLSFDMPAENIPAGERFLFRLAQTFSRDKIPTATLCYLWGGKEAVGYEQASLFTARVRFIVLANEATPLKTWVAKERNIHADFLKAFGQESPTVPALSAILIGADADNTAGSSVGYVGDIQLLNSPTN